jgi:hypothetical protein
VIILLVVILFVTTPLWGKCEDETHTPKSGNLESFGTPATSEFNSRGKNTLPWGVFCTVGKVLKCRCRKWPRMSHLDICSTSYGQKKGRESNCQFDSRPQKVRNRPDPGVWRLSATRCWKALNESYKFALDLISIRCLSRELWAPKVPGVQMGTVSGLLLGSPGNKNHWMRVPRSNAKILYGGRWWLPPSSGCGESSESKVAHGLSQHQKGEERILTNLLVRFGWRTEKLSSLSLFLV